MSETLEIKDAPAKLMSVAIINNGKKSPPRPKRSDKNVLHNAVEALMPEIIEWAGSDYIESEREGYIKALTTALRGSQNKDGYALARDLENDSYWNCDSSLVEILDGAYGNVYEAHKTVLLDWVRAYGITPKLEIGTRVTIPRHVNGKFGLVESSGVIDQIDAEQANYYVAFDGDKNSRSIIAYEEVEMHVKES